MIASQVVLHQYQIWPRSAESHTIVVGDEHRTARRLRSLPFYVVNAEYLPAFFDHRLFETRNTEGNTTAVRAGPVSKAHRTPYIESGSDNHES
jgi:hypothetical protein